MSPLTHIERMPEFLKFLSDGFMPHGYCLRWDGPLLFSLIVGNLGIALAYFMIPMALRYFIGKRKDLPYPHMFRLFAAFILSCGITHVVKVWTLYQPVYWIEAIVDVWTAGVSLVTAALLWPLIPQALALRSPKDLEESNRKLQQANSKLEEEIAERQRAEAEARHARDEAVQANQLKSQFVANVSHEVRTPLSGVLGLMEIMLEDKDLKPDTREIGERVFDSSKRLLVVLNDLLDFSKLEAGRVDVASAPFSIHDVLEQVVSLTRPAAEGKGLELSAEVAPDVPDTLIGDSDKIAHVLLNLVHNAVKFTDKGSVKIKVEVASSVAHSLVLKTAVIDTGIGISDESMQKLFAPFVQADGTIRRRFGGTGLGLSIARRFVELMGGEIAVDSKVGAGSTFWFTVPLTRSSGDERA